MAGRRVSSVGAVSRWGVGVLAAMLLVGGCTSGSSGSSSTPAAGAPSADAASDSSASDTAKPTATAPAAGTRPVANDTLWLCRPGMADNPCEGGLDSTTIEADGTRTEEPFRPAADPAVDCFYVYPTVSQSTRMNAPLKVTAAEIRTVRAQAARFTAACRLYAPMYRQVTRAGLTQGGLTDTAARQKAYADVLSAFNDYLNADNQGRPFVLIGHSQGSFNLIQLIQQEIDGNPTLRARMLSALLLGGNVTTAPGQPDHGTFVNVPACTTVAESGCVVAYSTYAGTPPAGGLFGRTTTARQALCVDPAQLLGRGDALAAYLPTAQIMGGQPKVADPPDTGFVSLPGRISGQCRSTDTFSWLDVSIDRSSLAQLPELGTSSDPIWGLHSGDVSLALGDLVDLVSAQSAAWVERGGPSSR